MTPLQPSTTLPAPDTDPPIAQRTNNKSDRPDFDSSAPPMKAGDNIPENKEAEKKPAQQIQMTTALQRTSHLQPQSPLPRPHKLQPPLLSQQKIRPTPFPRQPSLPQYQVLFYSSFKHASALLSCGRCG